MFRHDCPLTVKLASTQWNLAKKKNKNKTWRDSAPIDMFLSAVSVLVVVQLSSEVPEGLMNYPVCYIFLNVLATFIPEGVNGIFHCHNPSSRTMALGSTQPLTEMGTRNISWG